MSHDQIRLMVDTTEVLSLNWLGTIPGITITAVAGRCGPGTGRMQLDGSGVMLRWKEPGASGWGDGLDVSGGGDYLLLGEDPACWLRITVAEAFLVPATTAAVYLRDQYLPDLTGPDVTAGEAAAGDVSTWWLDVANVSEDPITDVLVWLDATTGDLEISADGDTWVSPTSLGTALDLGTIPATDDVPLHIRRTIGSSTPADPARRVILHMDYATGTEQTHRGLYRIFNDAEYRLYRSDSAPPVGTDTPLATPATLPHEPTETYADGLWRLAVSRFNGVISSGFAPQAPLAQPYRELLLVGGSPSTDPPQPAADPQLLARPGGVCRVVAHYAQTGAGRATQWAIGYTTDGSPPDPDDPQLTAPLPLGGTAILELDLPPQADATTVTVIVQTRRNDGTPLSPSWVYSPPSAELELVVDSSGPDPVGAPRSWPGLAPATEE